MFPDRIKRLGALAAGLLVLFLAAELRAQAVEDRSEPDRKFGWSIRRDQAAERKAPVRPSGAENEDLRVDTNLVVSDVLVLDRTRKPVSGLSRHEFFVAEDGKPQKIEVFSAGSDGPIPRSIVLVIDHSASQFPYIETSIDAAIELTTMLERGDRVAIVTDDVELLLPFTSDPEVLRATLESLKRKAKSGSVGKSQQYTALIAALNELFDEDHLRPIVIFQTDGDQLNELLRSETRSQWQDERSRDLVMKDIKRALDRRGATVYSVIPGIRLDNVDEKRRFELACKVVENSERTSALLNKTTYVPPRDKFSKKAVRRIAETKIRDAAAVEAIARESGGSAEYLERPEQAAGIYAKILQEMNQRYLIGYYPTNEKRDGRRRSIEITVRPGHDYRIRARSSYIASEKPH